MTKLTNILLKKELIPNFGIAAALDPQYKRVITKAFFSKMHMDIFKGQFLPIPPSQNWCVDQEYYDQTFDIYYNIVLLILIIRVFDKKLVLIFQSKT